jgi:hypothetical protein
MPSVNIDSKLLRKIEKRVVELVIKTKEPVKERMVIRALIEKFTHKVTPQDIMEYIKKR